MKIYSLDTFPADYRKGIVATIGMFDGVHCGHRHLLEQVKEQARACGLPSAVLTFTNHPKSLLSPNEKPLLLNTSDEKLTLLEKAGIDLCILLDFNRALANLTARDFIREVLSATLYVKHLVIGYDNRFGKGGSETFEDYVCYGKEVGMCIIEASAFSNDERTVSSSLVRKLLGKGEIEKANECLGYTYSLTGEVVSGFQIGRKLDFPTANVFVDPSKLLPAYGAYAVEVCLDGECKQGMLNIGKRPTLQEQGNVSVEVHLFDFEGSLYEKELTIRIRYYLRPECKFASLEDLRMQLLEDKRNALDKLSSC